MHGCIGEKGKLLSEIDYSHAKHIVNLAIAYYIMYIAFFIKNK